MKAPAIVSALVILTAHALADQATESEPTGREWSTLICEEPAQPNLVPFRFVLKYTSAGKAWFGWNGVGIPVDVSISANEISIDHEGRREIIISRSTGMATNSKNAPPLTCVVPKF